MRETTLNEFDPEIKPAKKRRRRLLGLERLNQEILRKSLTTGYPFKLANELPVTIYRLDSPKIDHVFETVKHVKPALTRGIAASPHHHYVTGVHIGKHTVYLIHFSGSEPESIIPELQYAPTPRFDSVYLLAFRNRAYTKTEKESNALFKAIVDKMNPDFEILLI